MFSRLLVANRGEIAIRIFRAATELGIRTLAVYTYEDRYSLHRYKADESYQIGSDQDPVRPYLDIDEIIHVAKRERADAIHPGYGFLSENAQFARRCQEEGLIFVGPEAEVMMQLGDKVLAKEVARKSQVPVIEDSRIPLSSVEIALQEAERIGYPIMVKAAAGGGGRGMRVVSDPERLKAVFQEAQNEAKAAFGDSTVFLEAFIEQPRHIEVQVLGDKHGQLVHLYERDCSVQRRFQKVVEIAPAPNLKPETRISLLAYALRIARQVNYQNAGTVEFLVDRKDNIYFIEVNPRIQVEHTVTEEVTGVDIVKAQLFVAAGYKLSDPEIGLSSQDLIRCQGFAVQCRITTEDPAAGFKPDHGTLIAYRNAGGPGIRLDEGNAYTDARISPFFDSLLVKITSSGRTLAESAERLHRALSEFRIRGVKTNVLFLQNVLTHPVFLQGQTRVDFIDRHPELVQFEARKDSGTRVLKYLAQIAVNGHPDVPNRKEEIQFRTATIPEINRNAEILPGSKDQLLRLGREAFLKQLKNDQRIHYTDTTLRDAHQSLLATRMRSYDMLLVADAYARQCQDLFSLEMWGGATFDVALRFLHEDPWMRLRMLRQRIPNVLFQMLIRGANAVGYTAYPQNLIDRFIEESWAAGIDVFRIFDSLNWMEGMRSSIRAVNERTEGLAEACICYSGDFLDEEKGMKFTLQYYLDLARQLEDAGAHILGIKDMAGLLKPMQAEILVTRLKEHLSIPIHLHTHDTSGIQSATYLKAIEAGVDIVDVALASLSGLTSQPNFNSIVAMMKGHARENPVSLKALNELSNYFETVREWYYPFESGLQAGTAEVYDHEIPGGQYSNLRPQARSLGLEDKFELIKQNYVVVNRMFGDIIKVTPSSKVVGDMALFMTANGYTEADIMEKGETIAFPESVVGLFRGDLGQNPGGFPEALSKLILKNQKPLLTAPHEALKPVQFEEAFKAFIAKWGTQFTFTDFLSYSFYPKVFEEYASFKTEFGEVYNLPTPVFFYGLKPNEEVLIPLARGKKILVSMLNVVDEGGGFKKVMFRLNGQTRSVVVFDKSFQGVRVQNRKAVSEKEIGAPLQGRVARLLIKEGEKVTKGTPLFTIEAMKMESTVTAPVSGKVKTIFLKEGSLTEQDDLVLELT